VDVERVHNKVRKKMTWGLKEMVLNKVVMLARNFSPL